MKQPVRSSRCAQRGSDSLSLILTLAIITFSIGILLGFIGAGGAGILVALLTSGFHLPVHQAIGTALAAMCFVTAAGAASHRREGNVASRVGTVVGLAGMVGAVIGALSGQGVAESTLTVMAGLGLWLLAGLVWLRTRYLEGDQLPVAMGGPTYREPVDRPTREWGSAVAIGFSGGAAAAFLGVGMAPFLQFGFLSALKLPLRQTVGTTMLTLSFISAAGTITLANQGEVSGPHLLGTTIGLASGSFIGARYTGRVRPSILRTAVVLVPLAGGAMLLFF